ncbi:MAG: NACHT domain-containing protein, partial [Anaerolineales bacterium]|nr:NACHT domain-containing protein [Anaerolineales bacterium]
PAATPEGEAKILAAYRAWVIKHYDKMQVLGMPAAMPLQQIFTDVYLLDRPTALKRFSREELEQEFQQLGRLRSHDEKGRVAGLTLAQQPGNLFILGKPGAGKTTFSKYLAVQTAKQTLFPDYIPVFVSLKELSDAAEPLVAFVQEQLVAGGVPQEVAADWLTQKKLLLLLDGLDEATARREGIIQNIKQFGRRYDQCKLVLTCRI